jgi:hypothetical protein
MMTKALEFYSAVDLSPRLARVDAAWEPFADWKTGPRAYQMEDAKYGGESTRTLRYFKCLLPPYFFRAVRSFGEYGAERDENRLHGQSGSQELFAKKPANTGDFGR